MALDIDVYRRTVFAPVRGSQHPRRISVIDIRPEGATQTVLFVHGFGGDVSQWLYQLRFFAQSMRLIAPNLRGHGLSEDPPGPAYTMESFVSDVEIVLEALHVQEPVHLIAHSFGGAIATEFVVRHPERVRSLVLIGVATHFSMIPLLGRLLHVPDPLFSFAAKKLGIALFAPQRTLKGIMEGIMSGWHMPPFAVPTLVLLGYRDRVFRRKQYEDVLRCNPGAQLVDIPVSAHLVQLERPDAVNRAIDAFLERQQPEAQKGKGAVRKPRSLLQRLTRRVSFAAQHSDMPWLAHYESGVPTQLPPPGQLLHELLITSAAAFPERPALLFFDHQLRYRELDRVSWRFAHALRALDIKAGEPVAIVLPSIPQCVITLYGVLKAGAVAVPGSPLLPEEELHRQLRDCGASVLLTLASLQEMAGRVCVDTDVRELIFTDEREYLSWHPGDGLLDLIKGHSFAQALRPPLLARGSRTGARTASLSRRSAVRISSFRHILRHQADAPIESGTSASDLALIQYTAGTTGLPKGVMLSHGNLVANAVQLRHWMTDASRGHELILSLFPLSHIYGITAGLNVAAALSGALLLMPTVQTEAVLESIKRSKPGMLIGYPGLLLDMANVPDVRSYNVSAIRVCISSSAPLSIEAQEAFEKLTRGHLVEAYTLTEASPVTHAHPYKGERNAGSIGLPLPGTNARIVDLETGDILPAGGVGELQVRGPQIMQGYWQAQEKTAQTVCDGWLRTGDVAQMDEDGFFTFIDRRENLLFSVSRLIYPREVEEVLYEHPKVLEVAVVSMLAPVEREGGKPTGALSLPATPLIKAFVVVKRRQRLTADELLAYARQRLEDDQVPQQIEFLSELPKNADGKVIRGLLLAPPQA